MPDYPINYDADGNSQSGSFTVRGALFSANATLTTGTSASLTPGDADYFMDIIEVAFSTNSTVAGGSSFVGVDLINDGTIVRHIDLYNGGTNQLNFPSPLKQVTKNTPWNVQMSDVTGTTVKVDATLVKRSK